MKQSVKDLLSHFRDRFYQLVRQIPAGKVTSYRLLAEALGDKRAARAVGRLLNQNPKPVEIPCHRVVRSNGQIGGYVRGKKRKKKLLQEEGVKIKDDQIVNFSQHVYSEFDNGQPLTKLRRAQLTAKDKLELTNKVDYISLLGGIDASYSQKEKKDVGYASLYLEDREERLEEKETTVTIRQEVPFPYIPTYLAFRELPLFLQALKQAKKEYDLQPDLLLVDGNGYLHPKKFGLACHLGVKAGLPTIGVSKSLLCGQQERQVNHNQKKSAVKDKDGNKIGYAFISSQRAKKPIYISPGHLIDFKRSLDIVQENCQYKIPRPIRQAHLLANQVRREDERGV